jgi:hypothetical protein
MAKTIQKRLETLRPNLSLKKIFKLIAFMINLNKKIHLEFYKEFIYMAMREPKPKLGYPYTYGDELSEAEASKNFRESMSFMLPFVLSFIICNSKVNAYNDDTTNNFQKIQIERVLLPPPMVEAKPIENTPMVVTLGHAQRLPIGVMIPLYATPFAPVVHIPTPPPPPPRVEQTPERVGPATAIYVPTFQDKFNNLGPGYYLAALIITKAYLDGNTLGASINGVVFLYILYRKLK